MNIKTQRWSKVKIVFWGLLIIGLVVTSIPERVLAEDDSALDDATSLNFYLNGIYFYNPNASDTNLCNYNPDNTTSSSASSSGAYSALKDAVRKYGEYAMQLQKQYGTPWEVVFAQMQQESGTGTCTSDNCVAKNVKKLGYYNWLGITSKSGRVGDAGKPYVSPGGAKFAMYTSVESMMADWAGPAVLRNGAYNAAFQYLDPNNYNLDMFLKSMIHVYAPNGDGNNNEDAYFNTVKNLINGPIAEVRQEMGWPSSAEHAKQENIQIGGSAGMKGDIPKSDSNLTAVCGPEAGNLPSYVLAYAWPEYHKAPYIDMMPAYQEAVTQHQKAKKYVGGVSHSGVDCGGFVTILLQDSGFDPEYNTSVIGNNGVIGSNVSIGQYPYVKSRNWTVVSDIADLQPGDVAFTSNLGHTYVYVGEIDGFNSVIASASLDERAPMAGAESLTGVTWYRKP